MTEPRNEPSGSQHPPDWSASDSLLQQEIRTEMRRIVQDEQWIAQTDRRTRIDWWLALAALALAGLAITAIVLSVVALNRNIDTVARAAPKDNSVGVGAIRDGAVSAAKLAASSVGTSALAERAVTGGKIAPGAVVTALLGAKVVTGPKVADNAITGAQIDEATLGRVRVATNALKFGGLAPGAFLTGVTIVESQTDDTTARIKGPKLAVCPTGTKVIGGGAEVIGATNVGLVRSAPSGTTAWVATARRQNTTETSWTLVVQAICGRFGTG